MDKINAEARHRNMAAIHSKETKPEIEIRSALHKLGFRFRKNDKRYPGTPDILLPKYRACIFVNGCFWHGHNCRKNKKKPVTNVDFWREKINKNIERDKKEIFALQQEGWRVGIVWECSIIGKNRNEKVKDVADKLCYWLEECPSEMLFEI